MSLSSCIYRHLCGRKRKRIIPRPMGPLKSMPRLHSACPPGVSSREMYTLPPMEDAPHIVVRAFERLVLFPLDMCVLVGGVIFLFEKAWLFGAFLLLMSLFLGMVGQALPH